MENQQEYAIRITKNGEEIAKDFLTLKEAMDWAQIFAGDILAEINFETYTKSKLLLD
jgi:hypothetical protein